jgi:hypothetical protein
MLQIAISRTSGWPVNGGCVDACPDSSPRICTRFAYWILLGAATGSGTVGRLFSTETGFSAICMIIIMWGSGEIVYPTLIYLFIF